MSTIQRHNGRAADSLRDISILFEQFGYADSSVIFCQGNTKVLVSVSMQQGVPQFLKGQGTGWLTAEYAMLPASSFPRSQREASAQQRNGRSIEISRLIGRCLRSVVDLDQLGEKTIYVDCDVLQADGGTRVACITAASIALERAATRWLTANLVKPGFFKEPIAALSLGVMHGTVLVDLDQPEDNNADVDFNFVMTKSGKVVEIQGTSEKHPMDWDAFEQVRCAAIKGISDLFTTCAQFSAPLSDGPLFNKGRSNGSRPSQPSKPQKSDKPALFSLTNR